MRTLRRAALLSLALLALTAGSLPARAGTPVGTTEDPWEGFNRKIFAFNEGFDRWILEPVATAWDTVLPDPVQTSVRNVFDNARFPVIFLNDLLQGRPLDAGETLGRFLLNSTIGLGGIWDVAVEAGWERHSSDFGQTLGVWGVPPGPYLVLPLFGASNPRDTVGLGVDSAARLYGWFIPFWVSLAAGSTDAVNRRSLVLGEIRAEREAAFDFYVAVRNFYIQHRLEDVRRGRGEKITDQEEEKLYQIEDDDEDLYQIEDDENLYELDEGDDG
jgi:phospholipid-binding lipoprotein MlaA